MIHWRRQLEIDKYLLTNLFKNYNCEKVSDIYFSLSLFENYYRFEYIIDC